MARAQKSRKKGPREVSVKPRYFVQQVFSVRTFFKVPATAKYRRKQSTGTILRTLILIDVVQSLPRSAREGSINNLRAVELLRLLRAHVLIHDVTCTAVDDDILVGRERRC